MSQCGDDTFSVVALLTMPQLSLLLPVEKTNACKPGCRPGKKVDNVIMMQLEAVVPSKMLGMPLIPFLSLLPGAAQPPIGLCHSNLAQFEYFFHGFNLHWQQESAPAGMQQGQFDKKQPPTYNSSVDKKISHMFPHPS